MSLIPDVNPVHNGDVKCIENVGTLLLENVELTHR